MKVSTKVVSVHAHSLSVKFTKEIKMEPTTITSIFGALKDGFDTWKGIEVESESKRKKRQQAIDQVRLAVSQTRAYHYDKSVLKETDRKVERELSRVWQEAGIAIREYDYDLYNTSRVKSLAWGDPRHWDNWRMQAKVIDLDSIEEQCIWLSENEK